VQNKIRFNAATRYFMKPIDSAIKQVLVPTISHAFKEGKFI